VIVQPFAGEKEMGPVKQQGGGAILSCRFLACAHLQRWDP
jgi:hypothetical protein